jgi:hypothetical protein
MLSTYPDFPLEALGLVIRRMKMSNPLSSLLRRGWVWLWNHPFLAMGTVLLLCMAVSFCRRQDSEWEDVYLRAAKHLSAGEEMYRMQDGYLYPPFMAWATIPFLSLPAVLQRFAWFLANVACLLILFRGGWSLVGGNRVEGSGATGRTERLAALLGCGCGLSYLQNCLAHQQSDIVIAAALVVGCLLLKQNQSMLAAIALGLAAGCKCTALLWAPYLLWRGRPFAAVWILIVAVGVNLLPSLTHTPSTGRTWTTEYASRFLIPITAADHYVGTWGSDPVYNQSLTGLGQRWCTTAWHWSSDDCTIAPRLPVLSPQALRVCVYVLQFSLLATVLWICGRPFRKLVDQTTIAHPVLEYSLVLLLMLLLSPMSSKAHFGTLVIPGFALARTALVTRSRILWAVLLGAVALGFLSNKDPLGERLYTLSLWYGVVTWQTLLLVVGCLIAYRKSLSNHRMARLTIADEMAVVGRAA